LFLSNLTSLPEIGGDVAFYFKSFNPEHMNEVFHNGIHTFSQNGLSQKIIKRGQQFEWKEKAVEYVQLYQSLL
jgi:glycogen synthase